MIVAITAISSLKSSFKERYTNVPIKQKNIMPTILRIITLYPKIFVIKAIKKIYNGVNK